MEGEGILTRSKVCVEWENTDNFVFHCQLHLEEQGEAEDQLEYEVRKYNLKCEESQVDTRCERIFIG